MDITNAQRAAISANCLATSWQALNAWRFKHHAGLASDGADLVVDWVISVNHRSPGLVDEMIRGMRERMWRIQESHVDMTATDAENGIRRLDLICGGVRWVLWFGFNPALHLLRVGR